MLKKIFFGLIHALNVLLIILTFALMFVSIFKPDLIERFIEFMKVAVQGFGYYNYLIVFGTAFIESFPLLGVVVPGQNVMLIVGGFFGVGHIYEVISIAIVGALLGNYVGYLLGVFYGESFFMRYGDWFGVGMTELKYVKSGIHKHGWWMVVVGKFHNMLRAFVPFIAGSMGMKKGSFIIYNIIGSVLRAVIIILLGVVFVKYYQIILAYAPKVLGVIMVCVMLYVWFFKREALNRYIKEKEEEIEKKLEGKSKK